MSKEGRREMGEGWGTKCKSQLDFGLEKCGHKAPDGGLVRAILIHSAERAGHSIHDSTPRQAQFYRELRSQKKSFRLGHREFAARVKIENKANNDQSGQSYPTLAYDYDSLQFAASSP
jgi:hypothetical protein